MVTRVHKVHRSKTLIFFLCRERVRMESQRANQIVLHGLLNRIVLTRWNRLKQPNRFPNAKRICIEIVMGTERRAERLFLTVIVVCWTRRKIPIIHSIQPIALVYPAVAMSNDEELLHAKSEPDFWPGFCWRSLMVLLDGDYVVRTRHLTTAYTLQGTYPDASIQSVNH